MGPLAWYILGAVSSAIFLAILAAFKKQLESHLTPLFGRLGIRITGRLLGAQWIRRFLRTQRKQHERLRLPGLDEAMFLHRPRLSDVYVSLAVEAPAGGVVLSGISGVRSRELVREFALSNVVVRTRCIMFLGEPGAGKTTTLQNLVCRLSPSNRTRGSELSIPIFVPMSRLALDGRRFADEICDPGVAVVPPELRHQWVPDFVQSLLMEGRCTILLDGLDELPDADKMSVATRFVGLWSAAFERCRFIVTCRVASFRRAPTGDFVVYAIRRLTKDGMKDLARRWFTAITMEELRSQRGATIDSDTKERVEAESDAEANKLFDVLQTDQHLSELGGNPLLLSLICLVNYVTGTIPTRRGELMARSVELLIERWDKYEHSMAIPGMPPRAEKENFLIEFAGDMFSKGVHEVSRSELENYAAEFLKRVATVCRPDDFVQHLIERTGLVVERTFNVLSFSHKAFEEYFVARHLDDMDRVPDELVHSACQGTNAEIAVFMCGLEQNGHAVFGKLLSSWEQSGNVTACFLAARGLLEMREQPSMMRTSVVEGLQKVFTETKHVEELDESRRLLALFGIEKAVTRKFSEFLIDVEIGRGGQAIVYKARHPASIGELALKVFHDPLSRAQQDEWLATYRTLSSLHHDHLLSVLFVGTADGTRFLATEYSSKGTADDIIHHFASNKGTGDDINHHAVSYEHTVGGQERTETTVVPSERTYRSLPKYGSVEHVEWCINQIAGICDALSFVHERAAYLHCDVKPSNLIYHSGRLKINDFDLVISSVPRDPDFQEQRRSDGDPMATQQFTRSNVRGTVPYIAPEIFENGAYSETSDVYALGWCLYELLIAECPAKEMQGRKERREGHGLKWRTEHSFVEEPVRRILEKACTNSRRDRFASARDFATALRSI